MSNVSAFDDLVYMESTKRLLMYIASRSQASSPRDHPLHRYVALLTTNRQCSPRNEKGTVIVLAIDVIRPSLRYRCNVAIG
jgi:hypothetical protein